MRFVQMNRDYLKGEYMESLIEKEENNWYSLEELSKMTGYTPDYIRKEVFFEYGENPPNSFKTWRLS